MSSQTHDPTVTLRKTSDKSQGRDILQNSCPGLTSVQVIKQGPPETVPVQSSWGGMVTDSDVGSWMGSWDKERPLA